MRIHITTSKQAQKPRAGDEKVVNGVTMIRQQVYSQLHRAYVISNGKPRYEWVEKGSERDRKSNSKEPSA